MTYKDVDLRGCLKWTFHLIKYAGYWFPRGNQAKELLYYGAFSTVMVGSTLIACLCVQLVYMVSVFGQLEEMINTLFLLLTHFSQTIKVFIFISRKEKIYQLLDGLEENIFKPKNSAQYKIALEAINNTNRMAKLLIALVLTTAFFFATMSLQHIDARKLPINGWYPFDAKKSATYETLYLYIVLTLSICGCANASLDIIVAAFISHVSLQLDFLGDSILHIKEFALLKVDNENELHLECEMKAFLKQCIRHHLKLKR